MEQPFSLGLVGTVFEVHNFDHIFIYQYYEKRVVPIIIEIQFHSLYKLININDYKK